MRVLKRPSPFRRMIRTAIALITVLPILLLIYFFNYDHYNLINTKDIFVSATILFVGWVVILDILLLHMLKLHIKSALALEKAQKAGMVEEPYLKKGVESLESVFEALSSRVKESFQELKEMSHKIEGLNEELGKKVNTLLAIMQIHEIFSRGAHEEEIFQFILDKLKELLRLNKIKLLLLNEKGGEFNFILAAGDENAAAVKITSDKHFPDLCQLNDILILDDENPGHGFAFLKNMDKLKNLFVNPLYLKEDLIGFLIGGNSLDRFTFSREDLGLINIFSKNIVLLWEHHRLLQAVEGLEIYDPLTGLYNKKHLRVRLNEEIKRAALYQRPCGLLMVKITNVKEIQERINTLETEKLLKKIAHIFKENLRPIDITARVEEDLFAAILIERNKRQCQAIVNKVIGALDEFAAACETPPHFLFSLGENPIDGETAPGLFEYAISNLK